MRHGEVADEDSSICAFPVVKISFVGDQLEIVVRPTDTDGF